MPIEKISEVERAILANQCHILAALSEDARDRSRYKMQADVLERGLEGAILQSFRAYQEQDHFSGGYGRDIPDTGHGPSHQMVD